MGLRLSTIITKTGDGGVTSLGSGAKISKSHTRIRAMGDVDELNSFIGLLLAEDLKESERAMLNQIQQDLFNLGAELALPEQKTLKESALAQLDGWSEALNERLPPLHEFILPQGSRSVALAHCCRAICRRAERNVVALHERDMQRSTVLAYMNRLSDFLFILARILHEQTSSDQEIYWASVRLAESE